MESLAFEISLWSRSTCCTYPSTTHTHNVPSKEHTMNDTHTRAWEPHPDTSEAAYAVLRGRLRNARTFALHGVFAYAPERGSSEIVCAIM